MAVPRRLLYADPQSDPHRRDPQPHWRIYHHPQGDLLVVCLLADDYTDYRDDRFVTEHAFASEREGQEAVDRLLGEVRSLLNLDQLAALFAGHPHPTE
jgi:hypothetical protein